MDVYPILKSGGSGGLKRNARATVVLSCSCDSVSCGGLTPLYLLSPPSLSQAFLRLTCGRSLGYLLNLQVPGVLIQ